MMWVAGIILICVFVSIVLGIGVIFIRARKRQINWDCDETATSVRAVVVDKYKMPVAPNVYGSFNTAKYVVVFLVGNEKFGFEVSEYSFNNYKVKETGILTYKGNLLIDFK